MAITPVRVVRDGFLESLRKKWGYKVGRIFDLVATPCQDNNFFIFVAAFFASIPEALFSVSAHDCSDNVYDKAKGLWRPLPPRGGGRHGRRGTPVFDSWGKLPGQGPQSQPGWQQAAWRGGDLIQRIGARMLIIDAALDLGINWMSMMLEWNGCQPAPDIYGAGTPVGAIYGSDGSILRYDIGSFPGNVGILMGIGGWITTVPSGEIHANLNASTGQFLTQQYCAPAAFLSVLTRTGFPGVVGTVDDMNWGTEGGNGFSSLATDHSASVGGYTGWPELHEIGGTDECGGQVNDSSIITVMGSRKSPFFANGLQDPCSNAPLTGTSPRPR